MSVIAVQNTIQVGFTIAALLNVGVIFLGIGFSSLGGAFVSGSPFRSTFSSVIRHFRNNFKGYQSPCGGSYSDRLSFIEKASMAMDYNTASDSIIMICCLLHRYLVVSNLLPSRYSYRMLRAAGRSSQTSKIQNLPFGVMDVHFRPTVNDLSYEVQ